MDHNIEASVGEAQESFTSSSKRRKTRSEAWEFYEKLPLDMNEDNKLRGKCKTCGLVLLADSISGTTNLNLHHLKHQKEAASRGTPVDHEQYREKIARAIVRHNYPFSFMEHEGIRDIHTFLNPSVKTLSRNTAKADVSKLYESHKEILKDELASIPSRICLTYDLWTSITSDGYMCVTAHYVDRDWILQKRILIFRHVPPPHSGPILVPKLISMLTEWGIEKKIFSITLDNARYNEGIVNRLTEHFSLMDSLLSDGKFVHIRCANHILNLIVKAGLKTIETSICNIRESIKYVKGSEARKIKFVECIKNLGLKLKGKVHQDVLTRWNSTFLMLNSAIPQLDLYLEEPVLVRKGNEDLDVLKFWKDNRIKYPKLSLMAHDLLSIPITSVASESAFSIGGRVIGKYQSSILPKNAEAKLCLRDWLYGHQDSVDSEEEDDIAIDVGEIATEIFN